ncbi:hypothetical protein DACRYDRAFT_15139 [Dacryopinax primogenitus]|uniref:BZIP domain-containing protein n=1 Tax=Dacryopinax primogenitus (strain DJM 731) TaxID=1858805 RepID=M5FZ03_DACPD|nr:uncharacterized protein DACRYDRAFT_15139 [Dacryopinax primogenitus]EJU03276.1 hypothetical protein DACRYDRAFT_15139 [Dacryopinax primogenitus]
MMEYTNDINTPQTPAVTGNNNDGSLVPRIPAPAYSVPTADFNQSFESLASEYAQRLGQDASPMFPNLTNLNVPAWFPSDSASNENSAGPASSVCPASPLSSTTQTLVDNFAFPTMYAPQNLDFSNFFSNTCAFPSSNSSCGFSEAELAFLSGFKYPAAGFPASPVPVTVALPEMDTSNEVTGKGKARELTPVAPAPPCPIAPAPVAGVKRTASEVDGVDSDAEGSPCTEVHRVVSKREQNRLAAQRSRARKVEEREVLEAEVAKLKDKVRELETALQTKNAENRPLTKTSVPTPRANGLPEVQLAPKLPVDNPPPPYQSINSINPVNTYSENGSITNVSRSAVTTNSLGLFEVGNTPPTYAAMMEYTNDINTPQTPAVTGNNNDGSLVPRIPAPAYSVPTADFNQSFESLASEYAQRLGQDASPMFPNLTNLNVPAWFPSDSASNENSAGPASSVCPASPLSSTTQTLVDNFAFPTMYAPQNLDFSNFFSNTCAFPSSNSSCGFSEAELAFLSGFKYPAAGFPASPVPVTVALPEMDTSNEVTGKGKARELTPVAPAPPCPIAPAPVAGVKRTASEVDGVDSDAEGSAPAPKSTRVVSKREQNRLAAQRSRARKVEEREVLEAEVAKLKDKVRELETALQTKNAENRVLREYMGRK